MMLIIIITKFV